MNLHQWIVIVGSIAATIFAYIGGYNDGKRRRWSTPQVKVRKFRKTR